MLPYPTEAEWEYACRAGTTTFFWASDDPETLATAGNVADGTMKQMYPKWQTIKAKDGYVFTSPVGRFRPNAFGIFDMEGNAREWCSDWYDGGYYGQSPPADPLGSSRASVRVVRGASWESTPRDCRPATRLWLTPGFPHFNLGFRVVRVWDGQVAGVSPETLKATGGTDNSASRVPENAAKAKDRAIPKKSNSIPKEQPANQSKAGNRQAGAFIPGSVWVGVRTIDSPTEFGKKIKYRLVVTELPGDRFQGQFSLDDRSKGEWVVKGSINGNSVLFDETGDGQYHMRIDGRINSKTLNYTFSGVRNDGTERFGKGDISLVD